MQGCVNVHERTSKQLIARRGNIARIGGPASSPRLPLPSWCAPCAAWGVDRGNLSQTTDRAPSSSSLPEHSCCTSNRDPPTNSALSSCAHFVRRAILGQGSRTFRLSYVVAFRVLSRGRRRGQWRSAAQTMGREGGSGNMSRAPPWNRGAGWRWRLAAALLMLLAGALAQQEDAAPSVVAPNATCLALAANSSSGTCGAHAGYDRE